jgi:hypothetical protein
MVRANLLFVCLFFIFPCNSVVLRYSCVCVSELHPTSLQRVITFGKREEESCKTANSSNSIRKKKNPLQHSKGKATGTEIRQEPRLCVSSQRKCCRGPFDYVKAAKRA